MSRPAMANQKPPEQVELRPASQVMRLERLGSFFPTRLSFLRSLLRKLASDDAKLERPAFQLNDDGYGHAVYQISMDGRPYSLIAYSQPLAPEQRTDRVIAEAWDACFVLYDGRPDADDISRIEASALRQEAGHYDEKVLVLSRANKSVRLFEHVVDRLSAGHQPDAEMISKIGYLMRTTAVYGNGKFGMADRADFFERPTLSQPFRLEMLTVYLIREFTLDLVDHVARRKSESTFTPLSWEFRVQLGIGNSTGLGMAPFLVSHPILINNWMLVRETALARVRAVRTASEEQTTTFLTLLGKVRTHLAEWLVDDEFEMARIVQLRSEFDALAPKLMNMVGGEYPWDKIYRAADSGSSSLQELMVSLVLEPNGELVDGLCDCMEDRSGSRLDPLMTTGALQELINQHYGWALALDLFDPDETALVWYVSEEKLEPRLGDRNAPRDERREMPHHIAAKVQELAGDLSAQNRKTLLAEFLMMHPRHRDSVRRIQTIARHPYGEIHDNLVARSVRPIDLLRCKLSFFGASKFDPRSDRWTRITLFQGAPTATDLTVDTAGDVFMPTFSQTGEA
ncbi:MAG: hypothetical protein ACR2O8_14965 [Rhizobiaceae bacterium]